MCNSVKKGMYAVFLVLSSIMLTACGGGSSSEDGGGTVINKPEPSSIAVASSMAEQSSSETPKPSSTQPSSSSPASTKSSAASSEQSYARNSRSNSSASTASSLPTSGIDTTPPSTTKLSLYRLSENSLRLIWDSSVDDVEVSHYEIERDGQLIAILDYPTTILSDYQLLAYTDYSYTITAVDTAGNKSEKSPIFKVRTLANPNSSRANSSASSAKSSNSSSSKSTSSASSSIGNQKPARLTWTHPTQRESGQYLELDEIAGYEIRYRKATDKRFTYVVINSNQVTEYSHADVSDTEFEIAVFDINGVYSRFVKVAQ